MDKNLISSQWLGYHRFNVRCCNHRSKDTNFSANHNCVLVDCAKDNRKAGRMRVEITPARRKDQVEQLRLEFMEGKEAEDGTL